MQMTYEQAMRPGALMLFAARKGSGYMMRSEKRGGAYGSPNRRPPRRKKAGFFYIFITLLLSVLLWPIGMVMLWQRKVRMTSGTKLVISLLTLCMSIFLIVFALTVPLDNVEYTAFQDKANDWLDKAAADVAVAGDATMKKTSETWQTMTDFARAGAAYASPYIANAIDAGVDAAGKARDAIENLFQRKPAEPVPIGEPEETEAPQITGTPGATGTPASTEVPEATEALIETDAPVPGDTAEASDAPETEAPKATAEAGETLELLLPETSPSADDAQPLEDGALHANGDFEPGDADAPTDAPEATDAGATPQAATDTPLLPTEAVTEAPADEATEAAQTPKTDMVLVPVTEPPAAEPDEAPADEPAEEPAEAPAEEPAEAPTEEPAEAPAEEPAEAPTEEPAEAPAEEPAEAPAEEPAEAPAEEPAEDAPIVWEAVGEPTETPAEAVTESPSEGVGYTVKPAGQATVYYFSKSVGFHNGPDRHDMKGAPAHTLQEAFDADKHPCKSCGMPDRSILDVDHIAWIDAKNRIHTTDECADFSGQWRLMSLDKALDAGYDACETCGADFYAEELFPAPTATPAPEAVHPATALKPAGEARVYFYDSSKGYHIGPDCSGMKNAPAHTLEEAVAGNKNACRRCNPPAASLLGLPALWLDENGLVHTSDECAAFAGQYRLVARDDALAQGLEACPDCGAAEYLIPGTVLAD